MRLVRLIGLAWPFTAWLFAAACNAPTPPPAEDPPEVVVGERLFLETRFAQFFAANSVDLNQALKVGDPVMDTLRTVTGAVRPGPFAGKSMNCRQCHLVDESSGQNQTGLRAYADFSSRSAIPARPDGQTQTPRNSPPLVNASLPRQVPFYLHFDGQFSTAAELAAGTLTGRNFGWLPEENEIAVAHIGRVIREDDGSDPFAAPCGGVSYATLLLGTDPALPAACRLPPALRLDVMVASDTQVVHGVANLLAAYMETLTYARDDRGRYVGSPFDRFLILNDLPREPDPGEAPLAYARRLRAALAESASPKLLDNPQALSFAHHDQRFVFGSEELAGLRIFLAESPGETTSEELVRGGIGNCIACHAPPAFVDFGFHNNGTAQFEYDRIHGDGALAALAIPTLAERRLSGEKYLPPSALYPAGRGPFMSPPTAERPGEVDLGLWNVFANDAVPTPQATLRGVVGGFDGVTPEATLGELLPMTIATFKTASLRDLGQSPPYFHNAISPTLEDAVQHYLAASAAARAGTLRNGAVALRRIALVAADVAPLAAFLRALNEDYE
jgi:cytochrome c peroxidase